MISRFLRAVTLVVFAANGLPALAAPPATCPTISLAPTSLPNGDLASAYTPTVTSSNGTAPVTIDITSGVLPNGVTLTDNGDGTATFGGTATQAGAFEFTITATDVNGCSGGRTYTPTFAAGSQTVSFTSTAPIGATVGGLTYAVMATATSGLPVALTIDATASAVCSIAGSTVSFIGIGTCVIDANQAGNPSYGPAPQVQQSFAVGVGSQTITFTSTAPAAATVGGATYTATATASSGLPVALTIDASASAICSIAGSTVSFTAVGTCVIDANQAGNANYTAAPQVQQSFAVGKSSQTINFTSTAPVGALVSGPTYTVTATATSGLAVTLTIDASASTVCSIAGSTVSFIGAGTCVIDANQAGNGAYNAAPQVQQLFLVSKNNQTISFTSIAPATAKNGGPTYTVIATSTSGLTVTFTSGAPTICAVAGSTVSFIGAGTCVINADQVGNGAYNAAPQVQQTFAVAKGDQTTSFTSTPANPVAAGTTYSPTATATSGLAVSFTIDASSTSGACSIAGSTVTFGPNPGTCIIDANQPGDVNWNAAPQVQQSTIVLVPANAVADSHAVTGNVAIASAAANGVLTNDIGTSVVIKSYGKTTGAEQTTIGTATPTAQAGSVTLNADGSYSYDPPANFTGADTFKYTIDNGLVQPSIGTVTLNISDRIMVVATAGVGAADCKPATACTLAVADGRTAVTAGKDLAFVQSGAYAGATFSLTSGQAIVGQKIDLLTALTDVGIALAADSVVLPAFSASTAPTFTNAGTVITLGGNNLIEYFSINPSAGSAITGNAITTGVNVHDIAITGTAVASGISLTGNSTGGTFNFSNLTITTAAGAAFSAVGPGPAASTGGTINITTGAIVNTLASTIGTALNVVNTTIGVSGLGFKSISANGGANGILLSNTGSLGGLTVNGDGVNTAAGGNASGGTIANMSGGNGATSGVGIYLNNTRNVVLRRMTVNGTNTNFGIRGFLVNGFTLEYSTVGGINGTNNNAFPDDSGEGSIYFGNTVTNGLSTQGTFTNNNISGGFWDNMGIVNTTAGTTTITVKGNTFGSNLVTPNANQSLIIEAFGAGTVVNSVVGGPGVGEPNTFTGAPSDLANFTGQTGTTMDVQFKNNVLTNNHPGNIVGGGGLTFASQGIMTFVVDSNSMRDADGSAMTLFKANLGTSFTGKVTNNTIGVTGVLDSASKSGNGIFLSAAGAGTIGLTIVNNSIRNWHNNGGMFFDNTGGSYTANFTIQGNTVAEPGLGSFTDLAITNGGNTSSDTINVCAAIGGATAGLKNSFQGAAGFADIYIGASGAVSGHTYNLPGYAGGASLANVQTFVTNNNTLSGGNSVIAYDDNGAPTPTTFTGTGTSCPTP